DRGHLRRRPLLRPRGTPRPGELLPHHRHRLHGRLRRRHHRIQLQRHRAAVLRGCARGLHLARRRFRPPVPSHRILGSGGLPMRYMMLLSGTNPSTPPPPELFQAIMKLGGEATEAGVLLDTAGLLPSASGVRVGLAGGKVTVTDGPFTESKELISYALYDL